MKILVLRDPKIDLEDLKNVTHEFTNFYQTHAGIIPEFQYQDFVYKNIPLEPDNDGDMKPTRVWWKATCADLYKTYEERVDHLVFMVHRDTWTFDGIWGVNYSNAFSGYQVQLCRFDDRNPANTFGTLYHEVMHSHDAFIYAMLGIKADPLVPVTDWDKFCVHGGRPDAVGTTKWKYIRHRENSEALALIAKPLKQAYAKRRELYRQKLQKKVIYLAQQAVVLLRQLLARKYGSKS